MSSRFDHFSFAKKYEVFQMCLCNDLLEYASYLQYNIVIEYCNYVAGFARIRPIFYYQVRRRAGKSPDLPPCWFNKYKDFHMTIWKT